MYIRTHVCTHLYHVSVSFTLQEKPKLYEASQEDDDNEIVEETVTGKTYVFPCDYHTVAYIRTCTHFDFCTVRTYIFVRTYVYVYTYVHTYMY